MAGYNIVMKPKMLTTREAAERLGITVGRVRQMVIKGQLPSEKFGRDLMIAETDLMLVAERKPGRPRKDAEAKEPQSEPPAPPESPSPNKPKMLTTAQKKAIRDEQQNRWLMSAPGKKAAKKAKE